MAFYPVASAVPWRPGVPVQSGPQKALNGSGDGNDLERVDKLAGSVRLVNQPSV